MRYLELTAKIKRNIFTLLDVLKTFPNEKEETVKIHLHRLAKAGQIGKIRRGLYCFEAASIDELTLAGYLYQPSYLSLETALNYYGLVPDVPLTVSSVTLTTTKHLKNSFGRFDYYRIKPCLFFGYVPISGPTDTILNIAGKEKAILDYFYLRKIKSLAGLRFDIRTLDFKKYKRYSKSFPDWVQKIKMP